MSDKYQQGNSTLYLFILGLVAALIGWAFLAYFRPILIEAGCSDIASKSSGFYNKDLKSLDDYYSYDNLKAKCLQGTKK